MDYRIEKLINRLRYKKIVIYGTGINAGKVINALAERDIIGILDNRSSTGYFIGKKIISIDEMILLHPEAIIIAAQLSTTLIIYHRISKICKEHHIALLDIFGNDLFELMHNIDKQKKTLKADINNLKAEIDHHEIISFDIFDTLIMRNTLYPEDVFNIIENKVSHKGVILDDFRDKRIAAEQSIDCISPNIYTIYDAYQKKEGFTADLKRILLDYEIAIENKVLIIRESMVDMMNYAINKHKPVYLISDMYFPKELIAIILNNLGISGYTDILVSCDYHQTKFTGLYHTFMELHPSNSYLHIGDNEIADGFCAKANGMDIYIIHSAYSLFENSSYGSILKKQLSLNERSMLGLFISKIFNNPFYENDHRKPYVDNIKDVSYLYFAPLILKLVLWLIEKLQEDNYQRILFSARDGFLIQELYDFIKQTLNIKGLPNSIYFQASRMLCARAGISSEADIEWMLSAPFDCSWKQIVKERFGLDEVDMIDEHSLKYYSIMEYAVLHEDKIYKRSNDIRENYIKYIESLGLQENGKYAFYDFVSCGTCQYFLDKFVPFNLQGLYCGYYDSVTGGKRTIPIKALFINLDYFQKETYFFKNYLLLEYIMTSTMSSVVDMDTDGTPVFDKENRSQRELAVIVSAQESIKDYVKEYITSLYVESSSISIEFVDTLFSFYSSQYTNINCKELEEIMLLDDFGKNILKITRDEL